MSLPHHLSSFDSSTDVACSADDLPLQAQTLPHLNIDELNTRGSVLIASQGKEKFTMMLMMGDEVIAEGISALSASSAPRRFEDMVASMVGEELEKMK
jgi:hypothetical protein